MEHGITQFGFRSVHAFLQPDLLLRARRRVEQHHCHRLHRLRHADACTGYQHADCRGHRDGSSRRRRRRGHLHVHPRQHGPRVLRLADELLLDLVVDRLEHRIRLQPRRALLRQRGNRRRILPIAARCLLLPGRVPVDIADGVFIPTSRCDDRGLDGHRHHEFHQHPFRHRDVALPLQRRGGPVGSVPFCRVHGIQPVALLAPLQPVRSDHPAVHSDRRPAHRGAADGRGIHFLHRGPGLLQQLAHRVCELCVSAHHLHDQCAPHRHDRAGDPRRCR